MSSLAHQWMNLIKTSRVTFHPELNTLKAASQKFTNSLNSLLIRFTAQRSHLPWYGEFLQSKCSHESLHYWHVQKSWWHFVAKKKGQGSIIDIVWSHFQTGQISLGHHSESPWQTSSRCEICVGTCFTNKKNFHWCGFLLTWLDRPRKSTEQL